MAIWLQHLGGAAEDANTLFSSDASGKDRAIAAASLAAEIFSPVSLRDLKHIKSKLPSRSDVATNGSIVDRDSQYKGGAPKDTSKPKGDGLDSHHCPAKNCYKDAPISSAGGPAIQMDPADHQYTTSYGNGAAARAYRKEQQRLLNEGRLLDAVQMDIEDVRRVEALIGQPGKYRGAIQQMLDYTKTLDPKAFINQ